MASVYIEQLQATHSALADALSRQDWESIRLLDEDCRSKVEEAMADQDRDDAGLRSALESLVQLYGGLVSACQDQRQRIAEDLQQFQHNRKGAKVYELFS